MTSFSNKAALPTWNFEYGEWLNSFIIKNNYFNKLKIYLRNFPSCQLILLDFNSIWRIFESRIGVSFRSNGTIINTIVILGGFAGKKKFIMTSQGPCDMGSVIPLKLMPRLLVIRIQFWKKVFVELLCFRPKIYFSISTSWIGSSRNRDSFYR